MQRKIPTPPQEYRTKVQGPVAESRAYCQPISENAENRNDLRLGLASILSEH
jgi:hypothetical protein